MISTVGSRFNYPLGFPRNIVKSAFSLLIRELLNFHLTVHSVSQENMIKSRLLFILNPLIAAYIMGTFRKIQSILDLDLFLVSGKCMAKSGNMAHSSNT